MDLTTINQRKKPGRPAKVTIVQTELVNEALVAVSPVHDGDSNASITPLDTSAECRRSSRKKIIKFDVRDLLNKHRKPHKIQIEARFDSNAPSMAPKLSNSGDNETENGANSNAEKCFIEKTSIIQRSIVYDHTHGPSQVPIPLKTEIFKPNQSSSLIVAQMQSNKPITSHVMYKPPKIIRTSTAEVIVPKRRGRPPKNRSLIEKPILINEEAKFASIIKELGVLNKQIEASRDEMMLKNEIERNKMEYPISKVDLGNYSIENKNEISTEFVTVKSKQSISIDIKNSSIPYVEEKEIFKNEEKNVESLHVDAVSVIPTESSDQKLSNECSFGNNQFQKDFEAQIEENLNKTELEKEPEMEIEKKITEISHITLPLKKQLSKLQEMQAEINMVDSVLVEVSNIESDIGNETVKIEESAEMSSPSSPPHRSERRSGRRLIEGSSKTLEETFADIAAKSSKEILSMTTTQKTDDNSEEIEIELNEGSDMNSSKLLIEDTSNFSVISTENSFEQEEIVPKRRGRRPKVKIPLDKDESIKFSEKNNKIGIKTENKSYTHEKGKSCINLKSFEDFSLMNMDTYSENQLHNEKISEKIAIISEKSSDNNSQIVADSVGLQKPETEDRAAKFITEKSPKKHNKYSRERHEDKSPSKKSSHHHKHRHDDRSSSHKKEHKSPKHRASSKEEGLKKEKYRETSKELKSHHDSSEKVKHKYDDVKKNISALKEKSSTVGQTKYVEKPSSSLKDKSMFEESKTSSSSTKKKSEDDSIKQAPSIHKRNSTTDSPNKSKLAQSEGVSLEYNQKDLAKCKEIPSFEDNKKHVSIYKEKFSSEGQKKKVSLESFIKKSSSSSSLSPFYKEKFADEVAKKTTSTPDERYKKSSGDESRKRKEKDNEKRIGESTPKGRTFDEVLIYSSADDKRKHDKKKYKSSNYSASKTSPKSDTSSLSDSNKTLSVSCGNISKTSSPSKYTDIKSYKHKRKHKDTPEVLEKDISKSEEKDKKSSDFKEEQKASTKELKDAEKNARKERQKKLRDDFQAALEENTDIKNPMEAEEKVTSILSTQVMTTFEVGLNIQEIPLPPTPGDSDCSSEHLEKSSIPLENKAESKQPNSETVPQPDPLYDIEKFILAGVNLLKKDYNLAENNEEVGKNQGVIENKTESTTETVTRNSVVPTETDSMTNNETNTETSSETSALAAETSSETSAITSETSTQASAITQKISTETSAIATENTSEASALITETSSEISAITTDTFSKTSSIITETITEIINETTMQKSIETGIETRVDIENVTPPEILTRSITETTLKTDTNAEIKTEIKAETETSSETNTEIDKEMIDEQSSDYYIKHELTIDQITESDNLDALNFYETPVDTPESMAAPSTPSSSPTPADNSVDVQTYYYSDGARRSHRLKKITSAPKALVGRGLVRDRDRERLALRDDVETKSYYSIEDHLMDLAEVEAKNAKFLKEMEERLSNFEVIKENAYHCERVVSREARKMNCDCFLTPEESERGELGCGEDCLNRLLMIECGVNCKVGERCTNNRFQKYLCAPCRVFRTEKKGFGIMADVEIHPGEFIMEYVGEVLDSDEFEERRVAYSKDKNRHYYFMALRSDAIIDATVKGNVSRFINHSCDPNAETQKWTVNGELRIGFFSLKTIMPGEEITFDYQYQRYGREAQRCYCESANCRGWIGEEPASDEGEQVEDEDDDDDDDDEDEDEEDENDVVCMVKGLMSVEDGEDDDGKDEMKSQIRKKSMKETNSGSIDDESDESKQKFMAYLSKISAKIEMHKKNAREEKKRKRQQRKKAANERRPTTTSSTRFLEDPDLEDEIDFLSRCGLKNQSDTLRLSRLMVRAKLITTRLDLLAILRAGELPCRRLFLDYHGLHLLHGWMNEDGRTDMTIRMALLETLESIPIPNKTILTESKVYQAIRGWCNNEASKAEHSSSSPSDDSSKESATDNNDEKPVTNEDSQENSETPKSELEKLALKLLSSWDNLPEIFRIPKRERIEQMKEHEREADRQYAATVEADVDDEVDDKKEFSTDRYQRDRFQRRCGKPHGSRMISVLGPGGISMSVKRPNSSDIFSPDDTKHLSKEQRRELFAAKVARDEAEKRKAERRREFETKCSFFGLDPAVTRPEDIPFCVSDTGEWHNSRRKSINTPPAFAYIQPPLKPMSTNPTDYSLPKATTELPEEWAFAITNQGKIYYYHVKHRKPQWEPPTAEQINNTKWSDDESDSDDDETEKEEELTEEQMKEIEAIETQDELNAYLKKIVQEQRQARYKRLVDERPISPRREEDRIYNQIEMRKYKENKEKIKKRKEEIRRRRCEAIKNPTLSMCTLGSLDEKPSTSSTPANPLTTENTKTDTDQSDLPEDALPIQDFLLSSDEEHDEIEEMKAECNNSPLLDKIVQGDKIVDELDALATKRQLKRPLPPHRDFNFDLNISSILNNESLMSNLEKIEQKKRKQEKKDKSKRIKESGDAKYRKSKEKFRCEIAGIIVQHLKPYRKDSCIFGRIKSNDDFNHLAKKLTHFVMVKELKYCESVGQTLVVTESVKNKSREFIRKYMAKYESGYVKPRNDPEFKDIPYTL